jgi:dihydropteroate synthase
MIWQTTRFDIELDRVRVMAIVNLTPDSFSDGGQYRDVSSALRHCEQLLSNGADILDIGGESSRPGAAPVTVEEEWQRVEPVLRHALTLGCPVSLDSAKAGVMRRALDIGVDIVNDIRALRDEGALEAVAASTAGVCLMHMHGEPRSMQAEPPQYTDVVAAVREFSIARAEVLLERGIHRQRIVLDPGIGFGKTIGHNFELLARQRELLADGFPLLVGWSRKSSLGAITGRSVGERTAASVAAALAAALNGARVVRVHDVGPTVDALKVWAAAGLPLIESSTNRA